MAPQRTTPGPDQESVWDYPRPPRLEPVSASIRVVFNGTTIAETDRALRILETSHPPTYYIPPEDVATEFLTREDRSTHCEWKGRSQYYTVTVGDRTAPHAAWNYPSPNEQYAALKDHFAFYASKMDACYVGDEEAHAQKGDFYGGWITSDIVGPFKGGPGSIGW
jgi:uncharacterized protein (DUF427 family)